MIISFIQRYYGIFGVMAAFLAGWYSAHTYYSVKQLKIDLSVSRETVKNKDKIILDMKLSEKITNDILTKSALQRQEEKKNYENVLNKLQFAEKRIDRTNHINADLVRTIQLGINGKTMSEYADATGRVNAKALTYRASSLARGTIKFGESCTENTNQLILLQEWNKQQYLKKYNN